MTNPHNLPAGPTSRKEAIMATITPTHRFAIADLAARASQKGNALLAGLFRTVAQVEAFPQAYPAKIVEIAEAIIADVLEPSEGFVAQVELFHSEMEANARAQR
jgi:hypothetical protein